MTTLSRPRAAAKIKRLCLEIVTETMRDGRELD
eukprot:SAG31_NODE_564_length_14059_cov_5.728940_16_plen_33_part_00